MDAWCATHLGAALAGARGWITSVGCVGLVVLTDGREAAIKVHQPDRSTEFLVDVQTVQRTVVEAAVASKSKTGECGVGYSWPAGVCIG